MSVPVATSPSISLAVTVNRGLLALVSARSVMRDHRVESSRTHNRLFLRGLGAERRRVVGGLGVLGDLALPILVRGPGTANLATSNSAMLPPVPVGYPRGRHMRRRRHAGNQVVRIR